MESNELPQPTPKELELEEQKKAFYRKIRLAGLGVFGFVALVIIIIFGHYIYNQTKQTYVVNDASQQTLPEHEIIVNQQEDKDVEEWEIYSSEKYRFSLDYPKGDSLIVKDVNKDEFLVQINYSNIVPEQNADGDNLVKGYIFKVAPLTLSDTNLVNAAVIKRQWFFSLCPPTASIGNEYGRTVAGFDAVTVDIFDCNSDYSVTYIAANEFVYEISQIVKGDLGFKQLYKQRMKQILDSLVIDVDAPQQSPYIEYKDNYFSFYFSYPRFMNNSCCAVPSPPLKQINHLITLAENDNSDAIGFFRPSRNLGMGFDEFVDQQKTALIDEYLVVKNKAPNGSQTKINIAGQEAVVLSGYSWRGNDLIFIPFPPKGSVIMISNMGVSDETFNTIINSLSFE